MKVQWFARGGDIARMGPFKTQVEASNALRLVPQVNVRMRGTEFETGRVITLLFPPDAFVWPEEVPTKKARKR